MTRTSVQLGKGERLFSSQGENLSRNASIDKMERGFSVVLSDNTTDFLFPEKASLEVLFSFPGLVEYILEQNTFFHGKIGFYERILDYLHLLDEDVSVSSKRVYTIKNLPRKKTYKRLMVFPRVASRDALNSLTAKCLNYGIPVWIVAHPLSLYPHLLMNFHNLFISIQSDEELKTVQTVLNFPKGLMDIVKKRQPVFVTDYPPAVKYSGVSVAITRIVW